ncbi:MAG: helix-turn-helix transcriptional regulator [Anaerolineales bacterium]|nr:helix-turn-helix transcriptional regulator [Anaerolineales bacterium]
MVENLGIIRPGGKAAVGCFMQPVTESLIIEDPDRYPGYRLALWHNPVEDFYPQRGLGDRFRIVLVEEGSGVLRVGGWRGAVTAPAVLCVNELEPLEAAERRGLRGQSMYFHPSAVNAAFTFNNIREGRNGLSVTEIQDRVWFFPFLSRNPGRFRPISVGPATARRMADLMTAVGGILRARDDPGWPCRSRSFFIELLILIARAFENPDLRDSDSLAEPAAVTEAVIMYLHANYHRKITLAGLSRHFHTNRTTLADQFHKATGQSVIGYLRRLRMDVAASILRDTELNLGEVMRRIGFRDNTHFGRTFRRYNGCTPSQYRRKSCGMPRRQTHSQTPEDDGGGDGSRTS